MVSGPDRCPVPSVHFSERVQTRLSDNGANTAKLAISPSQWGYGVFATEAIQPGALMVELPRSLALCEATAARTAVGPVISAAYEDPDLGAFPAAFLNFVCARVVSFYWAHQGRSGAASPHSSSSWCTRHFITLTPSGRPTFACFPAPFLVRPSVVVWRGRQASTCGSTWRGRLA